jgi:hypothetical protein
MEMRFLITLLLAVPLAAQLGPESPVSAPSIEAAAGDQTRPSMAWYGNSLPTLWLDTRLGFTSVRIAQLGALGRPQTGQEIPLRMFGGSSDARIASSGTAVPLVAQEIQGVAAVGRAGTSGRIVGGQLLDLATNGTTYLLLTRDNAPLHARELDAVYAETLAESSFGGDVLPGAVVVPFAGRYHVISAQRECGAVCLPALHDTIFPNDDQTIMTRLPDGTRIAAAATADRLLIAWTTPDAIELLLLTPERRLAARGRIDAPGAGTLYAGSDGRQFVVAWNDGALRAARVSASGDVVQTFTLGGARGRDVAFARTPATVVVAWSDGSPANVFTRGATDFGGIAAAPTTLASLGIAQQQDVALAGALAVWSEGETGSRIVSTDGVIATAQPGVSLRYPAAAQGAGTTLVAWRELADGRTLRLTARRGSDAPFVVHEGSVTDSDVAFDGASFRVVWSDGTLHATRIAPSGAILDTTGYDSAGVTRVKALGNGIAFLDGNTIRYIGASARIVAPDANAVTSRPALAADDRGRPVIVWTQLQPKPCLWIARTVDSAGELFAVQPLVCEDHPLAGAALTWDGIEFVAAWTDADRNGYRNVRLLRLSREGQPFDPQPLAVSGAFRDTYGPALAPSPNGTIVAYQRVAGEEPFDDVSRVFTRTLARIAGAPRGRSVGH